MNNFLFYKIYNGCNHSITFFGDPLKYVMTRKNNFYLTDSKTKPDFEIRQMFPLSIRNIIDEKQERALQVPEMFYKQPDFVRNYDTYDLIIVSNHYATCFYKQFPNYVDYLDRLFVPTKLFNRNPEKEKAEIIGCVGFQKYIYPKSAGQYITDIQNGFKPSKAAVQVCIDMYNNPNVAKSITDTIWLGKLADYVNLKGVSYEKCINNR